MSDYTPAKDRYTNTPDNWFRACGRSGLKLPAISLGMWHNFGTNADHENAKRMCYTAFDLGVTHFDLANNYGPRPGSAEERVGRILKDMPREELCVSSKSGFYMWPGPYGEWGSRKQLLSSLDASLKRLQLDYVDIFYHHRPDPNTPLEETMGALEHAVRSGKAMYAGISNYSALQTLDAARTMEAIGGPQLIANQVQYNIYNRWIEGELMASAEHHGLGLVAFCPLAQGLLTPKYLEGIPDDSRAASGTGFLSKDQVTDDKVNKAIALNRLAQERGQSLAQMALAWVLRDNRVTSALIGASRPEQIEQDVKALDMATFGDDELEKIASISNG